MTTATVAPEDRAAFDLTERTRPDDRHRLRIEQPAGMTLAAGDPDVIVGIAVCKPGVFNGVFEVTRDDLDAWVARFEELRGIFRPPLRIDHSWDILSVIGRFIDLRVENRPDEALGGTVVPMLVGDVQLVGTPAERAQVREWIKTGKLDERSSEFWSYRTNAGAEYPSVFAGCAFVDIPAVEGLGSITLRRQGATLAQDATTTEGTDVSTTTEQTQDAPAENVAPASAAELGVDEVVGEPPAATAEGTQEGAADEVVVASGTVEPDGSLTFETGSADDETEDEPEAAEPEALEQPVAASADPDLVASLRAAGVTAPDVLAKVEQEVARRAELRIESHTRLAEFTAKGVVPLAVRPQIEALLSHDDKAVRDGIAAVLTAAVAPVKLRRTAGVTSSVELAAKADDDGTPSPSELRELEPEEFGEAWAALTTEQRKSDEYLAAYHAVMGTA